MSPDVDSLPDDLDSSSYSSSCPGSPVVSREVVPHTGSWAVHWARLAA